MLQKLSIMAIFLSLGLILVAAFLGPEDFKRADGTSAGSKSAQQAARLSEGLAEQLDKKASEANTEHSDWCSQMDEKPNKDWQGDDFVRYAKLCLDG